MRKRDAAARVIGLAVFVLGAAILVFSFFMSYKLFTSPESGLVVTSAKHGGPPATTTLANSAISVLARIGSLFIMVLVGSAAAGRGVQMYFAGERLPKTEE